MIRRAEKTHVRFEPEVNGGTTYAFSFQRNHLVIGTQRMHRLIESIAMNKHDVASLLQTLIEEQGPAAQAYRTAEELLIDLTRLVEAGVLRVEPPATSDT